tara:strand:+ start:66 stop:965 length:900 start_codon:yes stop_codon:yes gene_type:complete
MSGNRKENSNIEKLVLGTAQFGMNYGIANKTGKIKKSEMLNILKISMSNGVKTLDTAAGYGNCQKELGDLGIDEWKVISKISDFGYKKNKIKENIFIQIKKTLNDLNINSINTLLLHTPDDLEGEYRYEIYNALLESKHKGLCKKIGISAYEYNQVLKITKEFKIDVVQFPYNIFNTELDETGLMLYLRKNKIEIHVRSIFLQGLLLMRSKERGLYFQTWKDLFEKWESWIRKNNISKIEACISYVLQNKYIDKIILGIDSQEHLQEILEIFKKSNHIEIPNLFSCEDQKLTNPLNWRI